ncbi:g2176 [Coccomyxa viridis]|uniref:G2176 protein n=1 Tax=Coccomyxa viridis TaxID=1274662 RepID=A0ABP1FRM5_9CHLO
MLLQLISLHRQYSLPDLDFILTTDDGCPQRPPQDALRGNNPSDRCYQQVMMPDATFGGWPEAHLPSWSEAQWLVYRASIDQPFPERQDGLFFRGAVTNHIRKIAAGSALLQRSPLVDVRIAPWGDTAQYLLHMRGQTYSARLKYLLACGSAVVFPWLSEEPQEWWYPALQNGTNVLLTGDITEGNQASPVMDALHALRRNESWAEAIGVEGRNLALTLLHPDNVARYWVELLTLYAALMTDPVKLHRDAVPLSHEFLRKQRVWKHRERTCEVCTLSHTDSTRHHQSSSLQ